jgi:hypothetical protein
VGKQRVFQKSIYLHIEYNFKWLIAYQSKNNPEKWETWLELWLFFHKIEYLVTEKRQAKRFDLGRGASLKSILAFGSGWPTKRISSTIGSRMVML